MHAKRRPRTHRHYPGFTLVELLVVIGIIAILAAVLLPAVNIAIYQAKKNAVAVEIKQLEVALETFLKDRNGYPPDFSDPDRVNRYILTSFPRVNQASQDELAAIEHAKANIDPAEALVFWLGGTYNDPRRPFTGGDVYWGDGKPRVISDNGAELKKYFDFQESRLVDRDEDGYPEYMSASSEGAPLVYFHCRTYHLDTCLFRAPPNTNVLGVARPYVKDPDPNSGTANAPLEYVNPDKYQIISAFADGHYGESGTNPRMFPSGLNYSKGDRDNLTNFSEGNTLEDMRPDD